MKSFKVCLLWGFVCMFLFTFIMGLFDDAFKRTYYTGTWYKDIVASFKYYVLWVLPNWWWLIIIGTLVLAVLFFGVTKLVAKSKI